MSEAKPVRPLPALLAPFAAVRREFADIARNPVACIGGLVGSGAFLSAAVALEVCGPSATGGRGVLSARGG